MTDKEKYLFDKIHSIGETLKDEIHIYKIDIDNAIRYRCDCGDLGSFEIAQFDTEEYFDPSMNVWIEKPKICIYMMVTTTKIYQI